MDIGLCLIPRPVIIQNKIVEKYASIIFHAGMCRVDVGQSM